MPYQVTDKVAGFGGRHRKPRVTGRRRKPNRVKGSARWAWPLYGELSGCIHWIKP